jgi:hypothetical protein
VRTAQDGYRAALSGELATIFATTLTSNDVATGSTNSVNLTVTLATAGAIGDADKEKIATGLGFKSEYLAAAKAGAVTVACVGAPGSVDCIQPCNSSTMCQQMLTYSKDYKNSQGTFTSITLSLSYGTVSRRLQDGAPGRRLGTATVSLTDASTTPPAAATSNAFRGALPFASLVGAFVLLV